MPVPAATPSIGAKISQFRRQRGWTQSEFAKMVGVHANHVSRWESDRMRPSEVTFQKILDVFGIAAGELTEATAYLPTSSRGNKALVEKMELVLQLDPEDQAVVFRIIDSLSLQKRVARLVVPENKQPVLNP